MEPQFRKKADGSIILSDSWEALGVKKKNKGRAWALPLSPEEVLEANKEAFKEYMELFPEGREVIAIKLQQSSAQPSTKSHPPVPVSSLRITVPPVPPAVGSLEPSDMDDSELVAAAEHAEAQATRYGAVQALAACLFNLKDHSLALTQEESRHIISLWQDLSDFDKGRTVYPPRHQDTLTKGHFRATKKLVAPGVESTRRSFVGSSSPAQWPNCNRVVEAIFVKLCMAFTSGKKTPEGTRSRWTRVIHAYKQIRECILSNAHVMTETTIQLPEVNTATLAQWYSKRTRSQETDVLQQAICTPEAPESGPVEQRSTLQKDTILSVPTDNPHVFVLPKNAAGKAILKLHVPTSVPAQQRLPGALQSLPVLSTPLSAGPVPLPAVPVFLLPGPRPEGPSSQPAPRLILPARPSTATAGSAQEVAVPHSQGTGVPYTTERYRKRKLEKEKAGIHSRRYVRKSEVILCKKCQKKREPPTHQQYFGNWYCEETATVPLAEWRESLAAKGYGKKNK
ncbi:hypothetical protein JZ751_009146 [Albula glossodonta]|uniref:Uncharacterized protein n=1 Tax=Albula glossodonta TaxID=121402 RepID=A0A8T2N6B8_9TELE|nr:hypothetical protein JZ751_009146 [Albula glossodonta]